MSAVWQRETVSGIIHLVPVMLGNCGDRMTAQGRGSPPCSSAVIHDVCW